MNKRIEQYEIGTMLFDHCATFIRKYKNVDINKDLDNKLLLNVLKIDDKVLESYRTKSLNSNITYEELLEANEKMTILKNDHNLIKQRI